MKCVEMSGFHPEISVRGGGWGQTLIFAGAVSYLNTIVKWQPESKGEAMPHLASSPE